MLVDFNELQSGYAKEIDSLHTRIAVLEQTIKSLRIQLSESQQIARDMVAAARCQMNPSYNG